MCAWRAATAAAATAGNSGGIWGGSPGGTSRFETSGVVMKQEVVEQPSAAHRLIQSQETKGAFQWRMWSPPRVEKNETEKQGAASGLREHNCVETVQRSGAT